MADRKELQDQLNKLNEVFQEQDLKMRKAGGSQEQRQMLRDMMNQKKQQLMSELGDDLQKLNMGGEMTLKGGTFSKGLDQSGLPDMSKQTGLGKFGKTFGALGKKAAGIIPLAGVGMAALSGDPAMAAEEAAGDLTGGVYDAIKSEDAGNRDEERQMLAERQAMDNYDKSPARLSKLKAMLWKDADVPENMRVKRDLMPGQVPSADAEALSSDEIMPKMQDTVQDEMGAAEQLSPEQMKAKRFQRLLGK